MMRDLRSDPLQGNLNAVSPAARPGRIGVLCFILNLSPASSRCHHFYLRTIWITTVVRVQRVLIVPSVYRVCLSVRPSSYYYNELIAVIIQKLGFPITSIRRRCRYFNYGPPPGPHLVSTASRPRYCRPFLSKAQKQINVCNKRATGR